MALKGLGREWHGPRRRRGGTESGQRPHAWATRPTFIVHRAAGSARRLRPYQAAKGLLALKLVPFVGRTDTRKMLFSGQIEANGLPTPALRNGY